MKNPKKTAGIVVLVLLLAAFGVLLANAIPTAGKVIVEMQRTPTPVPESPDNVMLVTPDPDAPTKEPLLRSGSEGQEVKNLQSRLYALGYYSGVIDGQFGQLTRDALIRFQKRNRLLEDGIAGEETRAVLYSPNALAYVKEDNENNDEQIENVLGGS